MNLLEQMKQMEVELEDKQNEIWEKYNSSVGEEKGKILQRMSEIEGQLTMLDKIKGKFESAIELLTDAKEAIDDFEAIVVNLDDCDWVSLEPLDPNDPTGYKIIQFSCCTDGGDIQTLAACEKCTLCKNCDSYDAALLAENLVNAWFQNSSKDVIR